MKLSELKILIAQMFPNCVQVKETLCTDYHSRITRITRIPSPVFPLHTYCIKLNRNMIIHKILFTRMQNHLSVFVLLLFLLLWVFVCYTSIRTPLGWVCHVGSYRAMTCNANVMHFCRATFPN